LDLEKIRQSQALTNFFVRAWLWM